MLATGLSIFCPLKTREWGNLADTKLNTWISFTICYLLTNHCKEFDKKILIHNLLLLVLLVRMDLKYKYIFSLLLNWINNHFDHFAILLDNHFEKKTLYVISIKRIMFSTMWMLPCRYKLILPELSLLKEGNCRNTSRVINEQFRSKFLPHYKEFSAGFNQFIKFKTKEFINQLVSAFHQYII